MQTYTSWDSGLINGEPSLTTLPHSYVPGLKPGVVWCHGAGWLETEALDLVAGKPYQTLADAGYPVISINGGGPSALEPSYNMGNNNAVNSIAAAVTYLQTTLKARPGGVFVGGTSMGFLCACNWARQNLSKVLGLIGAIPACDLGIIQNGTIPGFTSYVNLAYGGSSSSDASGFTAQQPTHDPQLYKAQFVSAGTKIRIHYSTDDQLQIPANQLAWAQYVGAAIETQTGGHALTNFDTASFAAWVAALT